MRGVTQAFGMSDSEPATDSDRSAATVGQRVFDSDGEPLGVVREPTSGGFVVAVDTGQPESHWSTSGEFGEAYLMWRCMECGEMGDIDSLPDKCPNCAASRESLYYWTED